jgi:hypothetical protein
VFLRVIVAASFLLLVAMLGGCASICCLPYECACAIDAIPSCDSPCDCGSTVGSNGGFCNCRICRGGGFCPLMRRKRELRIEVGPPAVRFKPEMPPEFLPVPPHPVFANVNMQAPNEVRGAIDAGYGPYFTVEGRD